jgi:hypothetical protein
VPLELRLWLRWVTPEHSSVGFPRNLNPKVLVNVRNRQLGFSRQRVAGISDRVRLLSGNSCSWYCRGIRTRMAILKAQPSLGRRQQGRGHADLYRGTVEGHGRPKSAVQIWTINDLLTVGHTAEDVMATYKGVGIFLIPYLVKDGGSRFYRSPRQCDACPTVCWLSISNARINACLGTVIMERYLAWRNRREEGRQGVLSRLPKDSLGSCPISLITGYDFNLFDLALTL